MSCAVECPQSPDLRLGSSKPDGELIWRCTRNRRAFDRGGELQRPLSARIHIACSVLTEL
jgi:hypothetical protein